MAGLIASLGAMGDKIAKYLQPIFSIVAHKIFIRTDSEVVLSWLQNDPDHLKVYARSRVKQVVPSNFKLKYIASFSNPADFFDKRLWHNNMGLGKGLVRLAHFCVCPK